MAEQLDESFDPRVPEAFVAAEPAVGALERSRVDAAVVDAPANGAVHEGEFGDVGATVNAWLGGKPPRRGIPGEPIVTP